MMKDKTLLAIITAVSFTLLLVILWFFMRQQEAPQHPGYSGRIVAETVHFTSKVSGRVATLHVEEGQLVPADSPLLELHFPELEAKIQQAEEAVAGARAHHEMALNGATEYDLGRSRAQVEAAQAEYELVRRSADRLTAMYSDSLIAAQEYDEMMARYQAASARKKAARLQLLDLESGTRPEQIRMARAKVQRATAALQELLGLYEERRVHTDKAIKIESVNLQPGELAPSGYTLISGYRPDEVYVRMSIPEGELGQFPNGRKVTGRLAATGREIELKVESSRVLPGYAVRSTAYPHSSFDEQWFEVRLRPAGSAVGSVPGNGAQVTLHL